MLDEAASAVVTDVSSGSVAWGDYDGDGDLDLVVTGRGAGSIRVGEVYRNDGAGGLTLDEAASAVIADVTGSSVAWGDTDGDGDLDLVVTGGGLFSGFGAVYRNDGAGGLTLDEAASAVVADVGGSSVAWGDYDGDGDLDLVVSGDGQSSPGCCIGVTEVYRNERAPTTAGEGGPGAVALALEAYPNPLAGSGTVRLRLPEAASAEVAVYDVLGRRVAVLHDGTLAAGDHAFGTPSGRLTPGVYVVQARVSGPGAERVLRQRVLTQKLTVLR